MGQMENKFLQAATGTKNEEKEELAVEKKSAENIEVSVSQEQVEALARGKTDEIVKTGESVIQEGSKKQEDAEQAGIKLGFTTEEIAQDVEGARKGMKANQEKTAALTKEKTEKINNKVAEVQPESAQEVKTSKSVESSEKPEGIKVELETGINASEFSDQVKNAESKPEKANIVGVVKDKNFEGSVIVKAEDSEGRVVGYALRKNSEGNLEGNKIGYMKDGSIGTVYQLHEKDFSKLGENGVLKKYESVDPEALEDQQEITTNHDSNEINIEKRSDSRFRKGLKEAFDLEKEGDKENLEGNLLEKKAFLADGSSIENQQIDVIKNTDGSFKLNFKLTPDTYSEIKKQFEGQACNSTLSYFSADNKRSMELGDCWEIKKDDITVKISSGKKGTDEMRSMLGLVEISVGADIAMDAEKVTATVNKILSENLGVENGLDKPREEDEKQYRESRYMWHHKTEVLPENFEELENNIKRQEVFPGYSTMIEEGKHKEYQEKSQYALFHTILSDEHLLNIIAAGGLMSTHERAKKGLLVNGKSSMSDLKTGGADSVFTRMVTKEGIKSYSQDTVPDLGINFVFKPDLLDRTDWYAYNEDKYGSTDPEKFSKRQSPEEIFQTQKEIGFSYANEQMFRTGIPMEKVAAIACKDDDAVKNVLRTLMKNNITEINGVPIEKFVVKTEVFSDFIATATDGVEKLAPQSGEVVVAEWIKGAKQIVSLQAERESKKEEALEEIKNEINETINSAIERLHEDNFWESAGSMMKLGNDLRNNILYVYNKVRDRETSISEINNKIKELDEKWTDDVSLKKMVFNAFDRLEKSDDEDERDLAEQVRKYERM